MHEGLEYLVWLALAVAIAWFWMRLHKKHG
jgi:hypothetical protein